jgi:hypothetical protein
MMVLFLAITIINDPHFDENTVPPSVNQSLTWCFFGDVLDKISMMPRTKREQVATKKRKEKKRSTR